MKSRFFVVVVFALTFSSIAQAIGTDRKIIQAVEVQGVDGSVIIKSATAWGQSCAGTYVDSIYFDKNTIPNGYNAMLATVLMAYSTQKQVTFYGDCMPNKGNNFMSGNYVIVVD